MIDYEAIRHEAIRHEALANSGNKGPCSYVKAVIEVYEAQKKAAPEWVPLDLATVKQGWELRIDTWDASVAKHVFVAAYDGDIIFESDHRLGREKQGRANWLMRAPKPKTVRVRVFKTEDGAYGGTVGAHSHRANYVGEGEIEVTE